MLGRDLTSILDLSASELSALVEQSLGMKRDGAGPVLRGQTLALIFEKPSLRTRVSFEMAMQRLGGHALYLSAHEVQMGDREPVKDVARVLSRMVHAIAARTYSHGSIVEMAEYAEVPVINALTDEEHPCQALADLLTLRERFGSVAGLQLVYVGEGNNIARSLAYSSVMSGIHFTCISPPGFGLPDETLACASALEGAGTVTQLHGEDGLHEGVRAADVLYTDVWASMGFEHEIEQRREHFQPYRLDGALVAEAPADALVMHDLPAHRGEEITDEVIESARSIVFEQAENRLHAQQAVLAALLAGPSA